MNSNDIKIVLVGVGGQGTILASDILTELGLRMGHDVKKAEVHGMSQRGGSVISHLRWAPEVFSPIIPVGEADVLVSMEKMEALRYVEMLKPGGVVLVNDHAIEPLTVITGGGHYPTDDEIAERLGRVAKAVYWIDGVRIAQDLGNIRIANVVMLGVLSALLDDIPKERWLEVLDVRVPPKHRALNHQAFEAGRNAQLAAAPGRA
jgi:indolepyruvate ferredoxin oxidoreductase beta subunit